MNNSTGEPTIPISEMFDFMRWTHEECYSYIPSLISFKDDSWGDQLFTASDLWNKYQEEKNKQI
jgi:hypothetical protein